jgi:hypothetical protein
LRGRKQADQHVGELVLLIVDDERDTLHCDEILDDPAIISSQRRGSCPVDRPSSNAHGMLGGTDSEPPS